MIARAESCTLARRAAMEAAMATGKPANSESCVGVSAGGTRSSREAPKGEALKRARDVRASS